MNMCMQFFFIAQRSKKSFSDLNDKYKTVFSHLNQNNNKK